MTDTPTTDRLAIALIREGAPPLMIERAREGHYDDYKSDLAMPQTQLLMDATGAGLSEEFRQRVIDGEFDATKAESDAWARSPEAQAMFRALIGEP